jgi:hypothetical protein
MEVSQICMTIILKCYASILILAQEKIGMERSMSALQVKTHHNGVFNIVDWLCIKKENGKSD